MNYSTLLVKIIEKAEKKSFDDNVYLLEILVKFYTIKTTNSYNLMKLSIWGDLVNDIEDQYKENDYIIVEGFLSFSKSRINESDAINNKQIEFSVLKVHPFSLSNQQSNMFNK